MQLTNGAGDTLIGHARKRGSQRALLMLETKRKAMADGVLTAFLHGLKVAANSEQMGHMIKSAEETLLVAFQHLNTARAQRDERVLEEDRAVEDLHHEMAAATCAEQMQRAIDRALYGSRVDFVSIKVAKDRCKEQLASEVRSRRPAHLACGGGAATSAARTLRFPVTIARWVARQLPRRSIT